MHIQQNTLRISCIVCRIDDIIPHSNMNANDVPAWDSLSNIRLVVAVEEEFGIQFSTGKVAC